MTTPTYLYKIISIENWALSQEKTRISLSKDDEEFIHLATEDQLDRIIQKYWSSVSSFVILKLKTDLLPGDLILEANPGGQNKYYHLYHGFIPLNAVTSIKMMNT